MISLGLKPLAGQRPYVAYTEELPGAISEGDPLEEARENLCDAVAILLETISL